MFKWIPPKTPPEDMTEDEFQKYLKTDEGREFLEVISYIKRNQCWELPRISR